MALQFPTILLLSFFLFSSSASTESAHSFPVKGHEKYLPGNKSPTTKYHHSHHHRHSHHHHRKGHGDSQICESVTHLMEQCAANFYTNADTRTSCCRDVKALKDDCLRPNLNHEESKSISIAKKLCSKFETEAPESPPLSSPSPPAVEQPSPPPPSQPISPPSSPIPPSQTPSSSPETSPLPPQTPSSPPESSPLQPPSPPPESVPDPTPHRKRPATCLVSTVLYDSCDPKYPLASSNGSSDERSYSPENVSTGFLTDGAGCCLGFAMFTNNCNTDIKDLSFANQKVFDSLQRACTSPFLTP